jgi:hypothetical protein
MFFPSTTDSVSNGIGKRRRGSAGPEQIASLRSAGDNRDRSMFKLQVPSATQHQKNRVSVALALHAKQMVFCDDLMYSQQCPRSMNRADLNDPKMQKLTANDTEIYQRFKQMTARGDYGSVEVIQDPIEV